MYKAEFNHNNSDTSMHFENIEEANEFWKDLWQESTGDKDAGWLQEVKAAIWRQVPPPEEEDWVLETSEAVAVIKKKKNWSAPGPDRIANFWWKRATTLHQGMTTAFQAITGCEESYPSWFCTGKTSLIPKPGEFCSANQRPITCLNTLCKWFTSCTLGPMGSALG